ncbi:unknown protein (plasmid) [Simkania negevensis Z]|uniref:Uncharacterized protein n=1 Tax=Simkania negevensis (strain ATCC VR-1471 / DSM 27360 / Z) TaxID=331113 RepID=F8L2Y2_SIMNZ|nr:unknown protein [Simkania negevensis Z]
MQETEKKPFIEALYKYNEFKGKP